MKMEFRFRDFYNFFSTDVYHVAQDKATWYLCVFLLMYFQLRARMWRFIWIQQLQTDWPIPHLS